MQLELAEMELGALASRIKFGSEDKLVKLRSLIVEPAIRLKLLTHLLDSRLDSRKLNDCIARAHLVEWNVEECGRSLINVEEIQRQRLRERKCRHVPEGVG